MQWHLSTKGHAHKSEGFSVIWGDMASMGLVGGDWIRWKGNRGDPVTCLILDKILGGFREKGQLPWCEAREVLGAYEGSWKSWKPQDSKIFLTDSS